MPASPTRSRLAVRAKRLLKSESIMVISTASHDAIPHTSTMLFHADGTDTLTIITHEDSLKAKQISENPVVSGVLWAMGDVYLQWQGTARRITSKKGIEEAAEALAKKAVEIECFWPPIFSFRGQEYAAFSIRVTWMRAMDLSEVKIRGKEPHVLVLKGLKNL